MPIALGAVIDIFGAAISYALPGFCFLVVAAYGLFDLRLPARKVAEPV
ncbi:hypothetical protein [Azotobacter armeniacus]